ncbi:hypothetical protein [Spiroplasma attinicola]|uniref:hypothetical protein n=1 Tax=Spiroplasma attinicola TaxID=2904537 RepID=UPI002022A24B|nr:hypothetical protein [Spiroplasma sp. JKS002670]MCL8210268.1 hypothetical protein [Spiroplasma sp. JKS002670]
MVKVLRKFVAGLLILTTSIIIVNTVACSTSVNSLSYMSDDVLENLGFISLDSFNNGTYDYKVNAHIGNNINSQVDKNDNVTINWDFTNIENCNLINLINKNNNLGFTEDINNFLIKKLHLKLNPKKEFNLAELNNYHLKVINNNLKVSYKDNNYNVSEQNLAVQWWKTSRNGPIFLKHAKFKLHIISSSINNGFNWSSSKDDWFDANKLTNIVNDISDGNRLNAINLNNAITKKAKLVLNDYSNLLNVKQFKINSALKEYNSGSGLFGEGGYWVIDFSLSNGFINFSIKIRL